MKKELRKLKFKDDINKRYEHRSYNKIKMVFYNLIVLTVFRCINA